MPFKQGQSGNPGGRPKIIGDVQALARKHTTEAIKTLAEIMKDKKAPPAARAVACNSILDRGYGKPSQTVNTNVQSLREMSDAELTAIAAGAPNEPG